MQEPLCNLFVPVFLGLPVVSSAHLQVHPRSRKRQCSGASLTCLTLGSQRSYYFILQHLSCHRGRLAQPEAGLSFESARRVLLSKSEACAHPFHFCSLRFTLLLVASIPKTCSTRHHCRVWHIFLQSSCFRFHKLDPHNSVPVVNVCGGSCIRGFGRGCRGRS